MKICLLLAACIGIAASITVTCKPGWSAYDGGCYILIPDQRDFETAAAVCEANGAYLATIESQQEDAFIASLVTQIDNVDVWIGLNDRSQEGTWMWDGPRRPMSYTNFLSGQPDGDIYQNCVTISWGWAGTTQWDDNLCDSAFPFVCESRPNDWVDLRTGHIYYMGVDEYTFDAAEARCNTLGGYLVRPQSYNENLVIGYFIQAFYPNVDIWLGLSDVASEGNWVYTDGTAATFTDWIPGHPDNGVAQNCATYSWGWDQSVLWDDNYCDSAFPYICEA